MKRRELPKGTKIDHRDSNSKVFVWLVKSDGSMVLYGVHRLCVEHGLKIGTFWYRWKLAGCPDEVSITMLQDPMASYAKKPEGWTVDGVWFSSTRAVANFVGRAESTVVERFTELGRREATFDELTKRKKTEREPKTDEQKVTLMPEGNQYTFAELKGMAEICTRELRRRAKAKGFVFWPEDLKRQVKVQSPVPITIKPSTFPRKIHEVEYNPTPAERSMSRF